MTFRVGVRLALDWGDARIGVAACDAHGTLAYPVETIHRASDDAHVLVQLRRIVDEYDPMEFVLGLPRHLKGVEGATAGKVRGRAAWLLRNFPGRGVRLVDERLTTVTAAQQLRAAGRDSRKQRGVIDQAAAVAILNHAIDAERQTGQPAGEAIETGRNEL